MGSYINAIGTANPGEPISQKDIASFMVGAHKLVDGEKSKLEALYRSTGISSRYSVIKDYKNNGSREFFPMGPELDPFPSTKQRMELFRSKAIDLSLNAVRDCLGPDFDPAVITHLIVVSCTGMYAPGLDIDLIKRLRLASNTSRTAINYMGCYAALNALKIADTICRASPEARVLVVCTELCSIHFQRENTENNFLANSLFGDGSAAVLVSSEPSDTSHSLELMSFRSDLFENSEQEMGWSIDDFGFQMKLTNHVPLIIKEKIRGLAESFLKSQKLDLTDIAFYAIHPGGKRILEEIENELNLERSRNRFAYEVLRNYGNMSSPSILFVLKLILGEKSLERGNNILGMAFGPGLTLESLAIKVS